MRYKLVIQDLKLPRLNVVLRWAWKAQRAEIDRVRRKVEIAGAGLGNVEPLEKAKVTVRAFGDYAKYDFDGVFYKDLVDSVVARPLRAYGRTVGRRWGLVVDDSRKVIGKPDCDDVYADRYFVEILVESLT